MNLKSAIISVYGTQEDLENKLHDFVKLHKVVHIQTTTFINKGIPISYAVVFYESDSYNGFYDEMSKMMYQNYLYGDEEE